MAATDLSRAQEKRVAETRAKLAMDVGYETVSAARSEGELMAHIIALSNAMSFVSSHSNYIEGLRGRMKAIGAYEATKLAALSAEMDAIARQLGRLPR